MDVEKNTVKIYVRLTKKQYEKLKNYAEDTGCLSISEAIRRLINSL